MFFKNQWRTVDFFNSTFFSKLCLNGIRSTNYMDLCIGVGMFLICDPPLPILFFCFGLCFFFFYVFVHNFLFFLSYNFLILKFSTYERFKISAIGYLFFYRLFSSYWNIYVQISILCG